MAHSHLCNDQHHNVIFDYLCHHDNDYGQADAVAAVVGALNASSAAMAPMPLTGTIGATVTGHGEAGHASNRRALPDQVTSYFLPTVERPKQKSSQPAKQTSQRGRKSNAAKQQERASEQREETEADNDKDADDDLLDIESSLTLLQSLRQARLTHLTALLPYLSTRHRTSTKYHPAPAGMIYPGGLDPVATPPPTLLHLGRADVRVGPFLFPRTRFGEARVEGVVWEAHETSKGAQSNTASASSPAKPTEAAATPSAHTQTPKKPATGKTKDNPDSINTRPSTAANTPASGQPVSATPFPPSAAAAVSTTPQISTPPKVTSSTVPSAQPTQAKLASSQPSSAVASPSRTPTTATPAAAAPINDKVVKAVSAAAQRDPALQLLLHAAANGKATPDQLRELAAFIAKVSEGLEKAAQQQYLEAQRQLEGITNTANASPTATKGPDPAVGSTLPPSTPQPPKKVKKKPRVSTDGAEKTVPSSEASASRTANPTAAYAATPPYPPIVTVEYRENPSARFVLPLWRGASVERRIENGERSIKVTMLLPAIGSSAAIRAGAKDEGEKSGNAKATKVKGKAAAKKAAQTSETIATSTPPSTPAKPATSNATVSPRKMPTLEQLKAPAPTGAETRAITWTITGTSDGPLSDGIWHIFGRVEGGRTTVDGVEHVEEEEKAQTAAPLSDQVLTTLIAKIGALSSRVRDSERLPKLRVNPDEIPADLPDHLTDRFAPRMQILSSRPMVRIKRGAGGAGDDEDHFEIVRSTVHAETKPSKRARFSEGGVDGDDKGGDASMMTWDGEESMMSTDASGKPKRKRHVAKFNPDGTLKLCQACGTNSTPMWRRGPAGKSTLCNACGAKWKVGRLVVPDQPPTMPPSGDEVGVAVSPRKKAQKTATVKNVDDSVSTAGEKDVIQPAVTQPTDVEMQDVSMQSDSAPLAITPVEPIEQAPVDTATQNSITKDAPHTET